MLKMFWEELLEHLVKGFETSSLYGIPAMMAIVCLKNCLEYKQRIHSSSRSFVLNFCLLLALGLGAGIIIGILTGKTPLFMTSDNPIICYSLGYLILLMIPDSMVKLSIQFVLPLWMISRHISALNSDAQNQVILSLSGRVLLAFSNYSGGLLFLGLLSSFDQSIMNYVSSSMHQSLVVNGTLSIVLVSIAGKIPKAHSVFLLVALQEILKRLYQKMNSYESAKISKKKLKIK